MLPYVEVGDYFAGWLEEDPGFQEGDGVWAEGGQIEAGV